MITLEEYTRQVNTNIELSKEIERLNNIINELEESFKSVIGNNEEDIVSKNELCKIFLHKIKELKGSDKE